MANPLDGVDVLVDYTSRDAVRGNVLAAIEAGVTVVISSPRPSAADFDDIGGRAEPGRVIASGKLLGHRSSGSGGRGSRASHVGIWEIINYARPVQQRQA
jgi:hypothetical protein